MCKQVTVEAATVASRVANRGAAGSPAATEQMASSPAGRGAVQAWSWSLVLCRAPGIAGAGRGLDGTGQPSLHAVELSPDGSGLAPWHRAGFPGFPADATPHPGSYNGVLSPTAKKSV